jgi:competence protein ComEC
MKPPAVDLRLPIAASSAWFGSFLVWWLGGLAALGILAMVGTTATALTYLRYRTPSLSTRFAGALILTFALLAALSGILTATLTASARELPSELTGRTYPVTMKITSGTKQLAATQSWQADKTYFRARLLQTGDWHLDTPVVAFGESAWQEQPIGTTISTRARLETSDSSLNPTPLVTVVDAPTTESEPGPIQTRMNVLRNGLREATAGRDVDGASLVAGLAIGDESEQTPALSDAMLQSGLSHLTAVSGGNTAIVLLIALGLARIVLTPIWLQVVVGGAALLGYLVLVGPQPSVLRASAMGTVVLVGLLRGGLINGLPVLSLAVFLLLLIDPSLAVSLGFALSAAATAGLLVLAPKVAKGISATPILRRTPNWLTMALSITIAAQIATAPILVGVGSDISLAAVPANLLVAPVVAPVTIAGLLAAIISPVGPAIAAVIAWPATLLGQWIARVAYTTSEWDWATMSGSNRSALGVVAILSLSGFGIRSQQVRAWLAARRTRTWLVAAVVVFGAAATAAQPRNTNLNNADWRAVACDVGQGSATLLRSGPAVVLVDTGPSDGNIADCLRDSGVHELAAVVITHLHADHTDGLADVLAMTKVHNFFTTSAHRSPSQLQDLAESLGQEPVPALLQAGDEIEVPGLIGEVLWPRPGDVEEAPGANNGSLVMKFRWHDGFTALVTGDVEAEAQAAISASWPQPDRIDVATVPHHGSANQDLDFVRWASPTLALVSSGSDNDYGHPSQKSLLAYERTGSTVRRTDESSSLRVTWENGQVLVSRP